MSNFFDSDESDEFTHVFGDVREPMMRAYYENLLGIIRSRYTHEQIMADQYTMPTGYGPGDTIATMVRVIAAIVAYVPVFGTAVAFVLNVATSLAQGEDISNVMLDGIRGALPGQPASTMCFDVVRAVAEGREIDEIAISALPIDQNMKKYVIAAAQVARQLAEGQPIDRVGLTQLYNQLPPEGQRAMSIAQRVANGENVGDVAMTEAAAEAISQGQQAVNGFIAAAGYQGIIKTLPQDIGNAVTSGNVVGTARRIQGGWTPGTRFSPEELQQQIEVASAKLTPFEKLMLTDSSAASRALELKGQQIANSVTIVGQMRRMGQIGNVIIDDNWRRGFDIGNALFQGKTYPSTADNNVRKSLVFTSTLKGFDAAAALQFKLTQAKVDMNLGRMISSGDRTTLDGFAAQGRAMGLNSSQITAGRNLQPDGRYRWGFDVGTAVCKGCSIPGPGQTAWRTKVGPFTGGSGPSPNDPGSNEAMQGFDVAQAIQFGITKGVPVSQSAAVGAGNLIAGGLAGSGSDLDVKLNALSAAANNPGAQAGVNAVVEKQEGFFHKIAVFFGLA